MKEIIPYMQLFNFFIYISLNSTFLFLIYNTNFIYEYFKLFKFDRIKIFKEYIDYIYKNNFINFIPFLSLKNNFFYKLISCPLCLNFWLSMTISIILGNVIYIGIIYMVSIIIFLIGSILYGKYKNI